MVSHSFSPPQISASSQIFPSLLMATPVPQARNPGLLSSPPSLHTSILLLGHIEFAPPTLSSLSLPFQPSYACFTSIPCQFCADYGFPSRLSWSNTTSALTAAKGVQQNDQSKALQQLTELNYVTNTVDKIRETSGEIRE